MVQVLELLADTVAVYFLAIGGLNEAPWPFAKLILIDFVAKRNLNRFGHVEPAKIFECIIIECIRGAVIIDLEYQPLSFTLRFLVEGRVVDTLLGRRLRCVMLLPFIKRVGLKGPDVDSSDLHCTTFVQHEAGDFAIVSLPHVMLMMTVEVVRVKVDTEPGPDSDGVIAFHEAGSVHIVLTIFTLKCVVMNLCIEVFTCAVKALVECKIRWDHSRG